MSSAGDFRAGPKEILEGEVCPVMDRDRESFSIIVCLDGYLVLDLEPPGVYSSLQCPLFLWPSLFSFDHFELERDHFTISREE